MCSRDNETHGLFRCFTLCLLLTLFGKVRCFDAIDSFTVNNIDVSYFPNQLLMVRPQRRVFLECTVNKHAAQNWTVYMRDLTGEVLAKESNKAMANYTIERFQCMHLGTYICEVENAPYQLGMASIDLATELCPPKLIKGQDSIQTVVSPVSSNQTFSFAALAHITKQPTLFMWNTSLLNGSSTHKFDFQMLPKKKSSILFVISIGIKNVSASDYGRWNMKLYTGSTKLLNLNITIRPEGNTTEVKFTDYREHSEPVITLKCIAVGYPRRMAIERSHYNIPMQTRISNGLHEIIHLLYISVDVGCSFMATYVCRVTNFEGEIIRQLLEVTMEDCNPSLCDHQPNNITTFLYAGESVDVTFCVSAHPQLSDISDVKLLSSSRYNVTTDDTVPEYKVHITPRDSKIHSNVTLEFINITGLGFGCYNVSIRKAKLFVFTICLMQRAEGKHLTLCEGFPHHHSLSAELKLNITVHFCVTSNIGLGTHIGINDTPYRLKNSNTSLSTTGLQFGINETETIGDLSNQTGHHLCGSNDHDTSIYLTATYSKTELIYWLYISLFYLNETNFREYTVKLRPNLNVTMDLSFTVQLAKKPPKLCRRQDAELVILAKRNDDVTVKFCVETVSKLDKTVNVSGVKFQPGMNHPKIEILLLEGTGPEVIVKVTVKNVTSLDFKMYDVTLRSIDMENTTTLIFVLVEQRCTQEKTETMLVTLNGFKTPKSVDQEIRLRKGQPALFECAITNTVIQSLWLHDDRKGVLNRTKHNSLEFYFRNASCEDEGTYHCVVEGVHSEILENTTVTISVSDCFPVICTEDIHMKTAAVSLGETVTISFCVVFVYNRRPLPQVSYNSTRSLHAPLSYDYKWAFSEGYGRKNNLTITIYNITNEHFKEHIFVVTSKNAESLELKIFIENFVVGNNTSELRSPVGVTDQNFWWIAFPIAFVLIVIASVLAHRLLKKNAPEKGEYLLQGTTAN